MEDGRYRLRARFRDARTARPVAVDLTVTPAPRAYFPPFVLRGADGFESGYAVPAVLARASGTIDVGGRVTRFEQALAYHDHNWGTWRDVAWDWGQAQSVDGRFALLYALVRAPELDRAGQEGTPFAIVMSEDGFLGLLRPERIVYEDWRDGPALDGRRVRVPGSIRFAALSGTDSLAVRLVVGDVAASRPGGDPRAAAERSASGGAACSSRCGVRGPCAGVLPGAPSSSSRRGRPKRSCRPRSAGPPEAAQSAICHGRRTRASCRSDRDPVPIADRSQPGGPDVPPFSSFQHAALRPCPPCPRAARGVGGLGPHRRTRAPAHGHALRARASGGGSRRARRRRNRGFEAIARCEDETSNWRDDSELARVNAAAGQVTPVSAGLFATLEAARRWNERTQGAFDATVEPLTRAYDLRGSGRIPDAATLGAARALVAGRTVELDPVARTVRLPRAGMAFDLGGIAKGEALDRAVDVLRARGVKSALLNLGGQVSALGAPVGARAWSVTLADPRNRARGMTTIELTDASVSTTAASERALPVGDIMLNHVLDPRSGLPAADWGSAAVIATRGVDADAASTALFVLGPDAARAFVRASGDLTAVLLIDDAGAAGGVRVERIASTVALLAATRAPAQDASGAAPAPTTGELARRIEVLAGEIDDLKLAEVAAPAKDSRYGLGPAASKVYGVKHGVSLGGYGEMLYQNFAGEREDGVAEFNPDQIDLLRAIAYVGYKFSDRIVFNSEIEFEHGTTESHGSVSVELAYLDYLAQPAINVRAGMVLPPMGFLNELHEPPTYLGARRPEVEQRILPSTWRTNGFGAFGEIGSGFAYRAYVIEGFRGVANEDAHVGGFTAEDGVREARQNGSEALAEQWGFTGLLEYERDGLRVGVSGFTGGAAQGDTTSTGESFTGQTQIWEAHAEYKRRGISLRALYAHGTIDEAEVFNDLNGVAPGSDESIGSAQLGWYGEAGYDVLRLFAPDSEWNVTPYMRYERYDTQNDVPAGYAANPANDRTIVTAGAAIYPHPQVVLKADQQWRTNKAESGVSQFNLAIGYLF